MAKEEEQKKPDPKKPDPYEISARFWITSKAIANFKRKLGLPLLKLLEELISELEKKHYDPSDDEIAQAKEEVRNNNTKFLGTEDVACPVCTIKGQPHYGLSKSQCTAQGGSCTGHDGNPCEKNAH